LEWIEIDRKPDADFSDRPVTGHSEVKGKVLKKFVMSLNPFRRQVCITYTPLKE
jgi:hypothetical protein